MPQEAEKYRSTTDLNVRAAPSATSKVLGKLNIGDVIEKLAESEDGKWVKFLFNGLEGWSSRQYSKVLHPPAG
jgi:uncharacterized protein YgiM (DUF1202 family)